MENLFITFVGLRNMKIMGKMCRCRREVKRKARKMRLNAKKKCFQQISSSQLVKAFNKIKLSLSECVNWFCVRISRIETFSLIFFFAPSLNCVIIKVKHIKALVQAIHDSINQYFSTKPALPA